MLEGLIQPAECNFVRIEFRGEHGHALAGDGRRGFECLDVKAAARITVEARIFDTYFLEPLAPPDVAGIDDAQAQKILRLFQSADGFGKVGMQHRRINAPDKPVINQPLAIVVAPADGDIAVGLRKIDQGVGGFQPDGDRRMFKLESPQMA